MDFTLSPRCASVDGFSLHANVAVHAEDTPQLLFWTAADLELKICAFRTYYNKHRTDAALSGTTPVETPESKGY
jgi:hypothetical protein